MADAEVFMKLGLTIASLALAAFSVNTARADIIILSGGWLNTTASASHYGEGAAYSQAQTAPSVNLQTTAFATFQGITNTTTYDFAVTGNTGHFQSSFDWMAPAVENQYGAPHNQGSFSFQVTGLVPIEYTLSGALATVGGTNLSLVNGLRGGQKNVLFENYQVSNNTQDEAFILGQTGGDYNNILTGSLTGFLNPGTYLFDYSVYMQTDLSEGANTQGFVRLDFGPLAPTPAAVPEPSTFAFVGMGLLGLMAAARRKA
jgi:hypothetical protein